MNIPILISLIFLVSKVVGRCWDDNDLEINGRCFQFNNQYLNWDDARKACWNQGYYLASIHSSSESDKITEYVRRQANSTDSTFYWFGLYYTSSNNWAYDDGSAVDYLNWLPDFPDQYHYALAYIDNGKWFTVSSNSEEAYLCSYYSNFESTVEASTVEVTTSRPSPIQASTSFPTTTTPGLTTISRSPTVCQSNDVKLNNRCYSFNNNELSQEDAKAECAKIGKTLAVFDTLSQINFITSYAQSQFQTTFGNFWIGLQRSNSASPFYWQNEGALTITNWSPGYPFNGQLIVGQDISNGKWKTFDNNNNVRLFSVCSGIV
ncbi:unnamed protein product [Caenorhabditis angaria]|uniref:C-type lectin domain-containing protein n=1 Tax=Caenorhabditis angaria TaxID=860376 RepID=A0A9P1IMC7_9PELO|nr:unnamed protein product [Caenorhabditis angaria]